MSVTETQKQISSPDEIEIILKKLAKGDLSTQEESYLLLKIALKCEQSTNPTNY